MTTYRRVGKSGLTVSTVGLGCNNLGRANTVTESQEGTDAVVSAALDAGITLFDVADNYGREPGLSETMLGKALGSHRDDVVVATKFGMDAKGVNGPDFGARGSRRYIVQSVEASLRRLGTDWIDLYQFHTPDPQTPIDETLSALDDLVRSGKVRYIGHSNRAGWQIAQAEYVARELGGARFISTQNHYNLLDRRAELEVTPAAGEFGLGVLPYFPLANGLLTGKVRRGQPVPENSRLAGRDGYITDEKLDRVEALAKWGAEAGRSLLEIAIGGLAAQPGCSSVIAGAMTPEQVRANAAAGAWVPTADELAAIDEIVPAPTA